MDKIKKINVIDSTSNARKTIPAAVSQIFYNDKNNLNIITDSEDIVSGKGGKINIEAASDIQIKPGDDIILYSHHRATGKQDEVSVKATDGDDIPVKLQVNAASVTITTKDKTATKPGEDEEMNLNVNTGKSSGNTKAYLKVKARAIDLRCEEHGGIALQPKGKDSDGHMNKIKFEHGGGDGLEFGTFNTEKASLFTDEYRFNKDGVVKMATRETVASDKADASDDTTALKYVKQNDDFYDVINEEDKKTTWEAIINAGNAFEDGVLKLDDRASIISKAEVTKKGNVKGLNTKITASIKNNLPATYEELVTNGGTITNEEYEAIKEEWSGVTTQPEISCTLYDIVKLVNWMKETGAGPWLETA